MAEFQHVFINPENINLIKNFFAHKKSVRTLFTKKAAATIGNIHLEIGFGSGEHLAAHALASPKINFIGAETFLDGCGALIKKISADKINNIRIWNDDARILLSQLPKNSVARAFILFPDPWPKRKHNKRRIINNETLEMLAAIMKNGSKLRIATDHPDYFNWMIIHVFASKKFRWLAESKESWETEPIDHITTRYQQKSLAGDKYYFLELEKI